MHTIASLTLKDLALLRRDPRALVNLFAMPAMFLVVMTLALGRAWGASRPGQPNAVTHGVPAWTLFGVFFVVHQIAASVLDERRLGTFRRIFAAPVSRAAFLAGKLVPWLLLNLAQVGAMFAFGVLVLPALGAPRLALPHPAALALLSVAASLAATALGLLLASVAVTSQQVGGLGNMVVITMAALGGVMVPRAAMPEAMQRLGLATPHAWALAGYEKVLVHGAGVAQVAGEAAALAGFAVLFLTVAVARFRWDEA